MPGKRKRIVHLSILIALCTVFLANPVCADADVANSPAGEGQGGIHYTDVSDQAWYAENIYSLSDLGLLNGVGDGLFRPEKDLSLAETITIAARLCRMFSDNEASENEDFRDSPDPGTAWYAPYVALCREKGVLDASGITDVNEESLNASAARAVVATLLRNALSEGVLQDLNAIEDGMLPDVPVQSSWSDAVYSLYRSGVLTGVDQYGTFLPVRNISRAEAAAILSRIVFPSMRRTLTLTPAEDSHEAVYQGIKNYGKLSIGSADQFQYRFFIDGRTAQYSIYSYNHTYPVQNVLEEGKLYELSVEGNHIQAARSSSDMVSGVVEYADTSQLRINGVTFSMAGTASYRIRTAAGGASVTPAQVAAGDYVRIFARRGNLTSIYITQQPAVYAPPVSGTPGLRTIRNLLLTATEPIGTTLYVYGGDWNWQDTSGSRYSNQIGIPQSWKDFYASNSAGYHYKNTNAAVSYYPFGKFNAYYYAGADCSGYLGWSIYNCLHTHGGGETYVIKSNVFAKNLSDHFGYGTWKHTFKKSELLPGDIISMNGHVWMCLGRCRDNSIVIMHSTPAASYTGGKGGGPELSVLGGSGSQAYALASRYMKEFYPSWSSRYPVKAISYSSYAGGTISTTGRFSWTMGAALSDPEGIRNMRADEILRSLYGK